jgi:hypothetical protein
MASVKSGNKTRDLAEMRGLFATCGGPEAAVLMPDEQLSQLSDCLARSEMEP